MGGINPENLQIYSQYYFRKQYLYKTPPVVQNDNFFKNVFNKNSFFVNIGGFVIKGSSTFVITVTNTSNTYF